MSSSTGGNGAWWGWASGTGSAWPVWNGGVVLPTAPAVETPEQTFGRALVWLHQVGAQLEPRPPDGIFCRSPLPIPPEFSEALRSHTRLLLWLFAQAPAPAPASDERAVARTLLGVAEDASAADVTRAYRRLMRLSHPDVHGAELQEDATALAVRLNAAYRLLSHE